MEAESQAIHDVRAINRGGGHHCCMLDNSVCYYPRCYDCLHCQQDCRKGYRSRRRAEKGGQGRRGKERIAEERELCLGSTTRGWHEGPRAPKPS